MPERTTFHGRAAPHTLDDDATLHPMGYPRKLTRRFRAFDNFAMSFTIINIISGIFSSFGFGMNAGGPRILIRLDRRVRHGVLHRRGHGRSGPRISGERRDVFLGRKLARQHKVAWSWFTGWLNFVGQVGGTAATGYAAATSSRPSSSCSGPPTGPRHTRRC